MKKIICILFLILMAMPLFAGGTENKLNQSVGYSRFPAKNTEIDEPDAVFYNPAGTALMEDGFHFSFGNQFIYKKYEEEYRGNSYVTDEPSLIFPEMNFVWKHDRTALFTGFTMFAGGGGLDWEDGNVFTYKALENIGISAGYPALRDLGLEMEMFSVVYGNMSGISHSFLDDKLSVAVAGKILYGYQTTKITLDDEPSGVAAMILGTDRTMCDTKATGWGFGAVFSIDYKPVPEWTFAATYHTQCVVNYEYDKADGIGARLFDANKGDKFDYNLPAYLQIGASWRPIEPLLIAIGANYYFNRQADYAYDDAWEVNFGVEYAFCKFFSASLGGFYSNVGGNSKDDGGLADFTEKGQNLLNPVLSSMTYCGGVEINFCPQVSMDIGAFYTQYFEDEWHGIKVNKWIWEIAAGLTFKL